MSHSPAHLLTSASYFVIGGVLLWTGWRLYRLHPINRALILAPILTPDGVKLIMSMWWLVPLFGAFIFACALDHVADWLMDRGIWGGFITPEIMDDLSTFEASVSLATAILVAWLRFRKWSK